MIGNAVENKVGRFNKGDIIIETTITSIYDLKTRKFL